MWNPNYDKITLSMKQKQTHRHRRKTYGYQRREGGGEISQEFD